jgi:small subunit ribosomal protein S6
MAPVPAYDLLVLIDPEAPEERRTAIVEGLRKQIAAGEGTIKADVDWGVRKLAYEIRHHPEAHYHLFQLEASPELLKQLQHSLMIDDGVLRHRVIRLTKGAPDQPPPPPSSSRPAARAEESASSEPEALEQPIPSEQEQPAAPEQTQSA